MGNTESKVEIGPKSSLERGLEMTNTEIDYKDPQNSKKAKKELYALFLDDKLVHVSRVEESTERISQLEESNKRLQEELDNYKKLNRPSIPERDDDNEDRGNKDESGGEETESSESESDDSAPDSNPESDDSELDNKHKLSKVISSRHKHSSRTGNKEQDIRLSRIADKIKAAQKRLSSSRISSRTSSKLPHKSSRSSRDEVDYKDEEQDEQDVEDSVD
jgi:hypothetical protein